MSGLSEKDLRTSYRHRLEKIYTYITDTWPKGGFEAYAYLFSEILDNVRKDFLTGTTFYTDPHGRLMPVENDLDTLRSFASTVGLKPRAVQDHLLRYLKFLKPRWLIDVPTWDGVDRVRTLCYGTKIDNLSQECFYQHVLDWGAGIFGRAFDPTYQNRVLILRGAQGIGKDFFIKTLCKSLGPYFGTWTNTRDERELLMLMDRSLVINIPEFDNTHKNEIAMLKALITKYQATFRSPYARKAESIELRTSFISSANVEYLLRDSTGNRRFLIFVVNKFDLMDKFDEFDSNQILAQFKNAFEAKFRVDKIQDDAMRGYIESQTPQPFEDQVMDSWNAEMRAYCKLNSSVPSEWVPAHLVSHIFEKLKKEHGIGRNHLSVLLTNRGCKARRNSGIYYCAMTALSVVKSE